MLTDDEIELYEAAGIMDQAHWELIGCFRNNSIEFMKKYKDKFDWDFISSSRVLSEEEIDTFIDDLRWDHIMINPNVSESLKAKYIPVKVDDHIVGFYKIEDMK